MKFGGTSVGNPDRMKALIPLINDEDKKDCCIVGNVRYNKQPCGDN